MAYPTLEETLAYYSREDISSYIFEATKIWHVVLVIPAKKRWEINWATDTVTPEYRSELIHTLKKRIAQAVPHHSPDMSLPFYPSFHVISVLRSQWASDGCAYSTKASISLSNCSSR